MSIKEKKIITERKINEALVEFTEETDLIIEEVNFSTEAKMGYNDKKDYRIKIKASIK